MGNAFGTNNFQLINTREDPLYKRTAAVTGSDYKGDFYKLLGDVLTKSLTEGLPDLKNYKQYSEGNINKSYNKASTNLKESLAGRGNLGSGAALSAMTDLEGERFSALSENDLGLSELDTNYKQNALKNLLFLNQSGGQANLSADNMLLAFKQYFENQRQFNENLEFQKENQPDDFMQLLGAILGGGTQVATARALNG